MKMLWQKKLQDDGILPKRRYEMRKEVVKCDKCKKDLVRAKREWLNVHEDESFVNFQDYKKLYPNVFK